MADVAQLPIASTAVVAPSGSSSVGDLPVAVSPTAAAASTTTPSSPAASDPISNENLENESPDSNNGLDSSLHQSQDKSNNSHHHESEYDTASDLEDGEDDYDDDDDSLGQSGDDDDNSDSDNSTDLDADRQRGDGQEQPTTAQGELPKKVDEDRSNPQYIPKKGTFYEHDDRTADEPISHENNTEEVDDGEGGDGVSKSSTPNISTASKTMKKWQPASGGDRWSHDRYDESEQAPKSRAELVNSYGYDIRNEDGPPRARRRRHYARGPTKYERKWEDEDAYIKVANNPARKPPRPDEFPALGDRKGPRKSRSFREEKENRYDRQNERNSGQTHRASGSFRDRDNNRRSGGKSFRAGGRQPAMEFKNKNRSMDGNRGQPNRPHNDREHFTRTVHNTPGDDKTQVESASFTNTKVANPVNNQVVYNGMEGSQQNQVVHHQINQSASGFRDLKDKMNIINSTMQQQQRPQPPQVSQNSHLSSRLQQVQQVQNRNDPSHVGSVQMNSLVSAQNQPNVHQQAMMQAGPNSNSIQNSLEMQQQQNMGQEQGRSKRYSSLRQRAPQPEPQQQLDPHSMQQQLQLQHDAAQLQQLQDQHLLQANLLQLYHQQENLQAQMQAQVAAAAPSHPQAKPQYPNVVQPQYQPAAAQPQAAYYAPQPPQASVAPPQQPQYTQPQPQAYLQQAPPTAQIAYNAAPNPQALNQPPPVPPSSVAPAPNPMNFVQTPTQNAPPPAAGPYANYPSYHQNYNTVGGTTYFVSQPQPPQRSVVLPQRRPTNAIPILPPADKNKRSQEKDEDKNSNSSNSMTTSASSSTAPIGSAENIDHILDNMFVQRPPYEPPTRKSASPPSDDVSATVAAAATVDSTTNTLAAEAGQSAENRIEEAVKNMSISDESKTMTAVPETKLVDEQVQCQLQAPNTTSIAVGDAPANETG